ncbi:RING-H2 finger protein ATL16 [Vigna radiata var. radiata]|uniref:RING-type E3 ubiquitin transferase n=1 Tax=Vigna radiata var. radiata TaxID=3916 RepID=A0A3Q0FF85_VIGRR|nr:RING-H2 finger protein ATL16 [Vigna radiata var. radiata]
MALNKNHSYNNKLGYEALPPIKALAETLQHQPQPSSSDYAFPIFVIVVLSILATVLLLLSYFTFLTKYCSNWRQVNPMRWISLLRIRHNEDPFIAFSPAMWNRGLDESVIREIPTFQFIKGEEGEDQSVYGCVVCLAEFKEHDVLKVLPNCNHAFHLDCIDVWLQANSNCPLCRSSISGNTHCPLDHIIAPSSSPQDSQLLSNMGSDEDFVVIELGGEPGAVLPQVQQERNDSRGSLTHRNHSTRKVEHLKPRKCHHVSIMGDECIDIRKKDDQFLIQPIRRSFSMDSAHDRQTYLDAQVIIQQNRHQNEAGASEYYNSRCRRAFFPFCYGKGSKNAVLPLENDV